MYCEQSSQNNTPPLSIQFNIPSILFFFRGTYLTLTLIKKLKIWRHWKKVFSRESCIIRNILFVKYQGHSDLISKYNTLSCPNTYTYKIWRHHVFWKENFGSRQYVSTDRQHFETSIPPSISFEGNNYKFLNDRCFAFVKIKKLYYYLHR